MRTQAKQKAVPKDRSLDAVSISLASTGLSERSLSQRSLSKPSAPVRNHDPLYLFSCQLEWHRGRSLGTYQELVAALDDTDRRIRLIAEMMLHRGSPRPQRESRGVFPR